MKSQRITKVSRIHHLGIMNVCTKFHGNPTVIGIFHSKNKCQRKLHSNQSCICYDISVCTKVVHRLTNSNLLRFLRGDRLLWMLRWEERASQQRGRKRFEQQRKLSTKLSLKSATTTNRKRQTDRLNLAVCGALMSGFVFIFRPAFLPRDAT